MVMGRPPKPTNLKKLAGTDRKDRVMEGEPQPKRTRTVPPAPTHLSEDAKKEWRRIAKELHGLGLLTSIDRTALVLYCENYATWVDAVKKVQEKGPIVKTSNGNPIQNPYFAIASSAEKRLVRLLVEFGMTPSSRTRINVNAQEEEDPYQAFLSQETPVPAELQEWRVLDE